MADEESPAGEEPPLDTPAEEAPPESAIDETAEAAPTEGEGGVTEGGTEGFPDSGEGEGTTASRQPSSATPPEAISDPNAGQDDILHDPEIEVLEEAGLIEEVHIIGQDEEDLGDEGSIGEGEESPSDTAKEEKKVTIPDEDSPEDQLFEKSKSLMDVMKDSSMDILTKKELLDKKKQKVLGSIISIRRGDPTFFDRQKVPKFQNSYKLDSDKPFNYQKVELILREVLEEALNELTYDPDKCSKQAKWASSAIRAKVKEQEFERYKIICYVSIGEKLCQDILVMLRFLWDQERDGYAMYVHETMTMLGIGICFGIYYE